ncbi:hypothetical protein PILCRDRAFT_812015 [Piloderma croceum F 1598]|uniref:FAD-binding domain-containing protein n=1 Tax=Piloderma croceum (strain F 1598) TaxID=765440 RepID=A0A0C3G1U7_PILCF|nr:hypothetical protein PILCRDRAFT_812015 [Piloderma croceum F 1598]
MSQTKESKIDVLVIGAGPAGLMCANGLAKAGVKVRIIDKKSNKISAGHADGIQPRTIEVLQSYGLADRLLRDACQLHMVAFWNPGPNGGIERTDKTRDVSVPTARYPFEATLHQGEIEQIFVDSMLDAGVAVDRPIYPFALEMSKDVAILADPNAHPIRVHLSSPDGQVDTEIVNAKFVVGADGAHSWVRKTLGIDMTGEQSEYIWGVVDMVPETDFPDIRYRCAIHSHNGSCMIIPREGDLIRLYIQLSDKDALDPSTGRVDRDKMSPEMLLEVARKSLYPYKIGTPKVFEWFTIYIIGQRVASRFSVQERVFIVGDACHTHSPKAGQGMNASMNDSHNLVWKITHALRGWADMSLLKTYEYERRKFAQDLIHFDKEFSALFSGKPRTEENQNGVSHEQFSQAFRTFGAFTSGIGIHYAESAIVNAKHQSVAKDLIIGQRIIPQILIRVADARPFELQDLLPADTRFKVLIFAGDITNVAQRMKVDKLGEEISKPESFLNKYSPGGEWKKVFDMLAIVSGKKEQVEYTMLPEFFRSHWSKVLIDDVDLTGRQGGKAYTSYGIGPSGAVIVVRPDGYVGFISPFDSIRDVDDYFASFMKVPS